jgi:nitrogen fixation/metabolism regulation signal transduction histidine kinase
LAPRFGIRRRLTFAILVTALIPVLVAVWLAETTVRQTAARFFVPEVGAHLDRSLELYQELARTVKAGMRSEAAAIAADEALRHAAERRDGAALERALRRLFAGHQGLVSLAVRESEDAPAVEVTRGWPLDARTENRFEVVRSLGPVRGERRLAPRDDVKTAPSGAETRSGAETPPHEAEPPPHEAETPSGAETPPHEAETPSGAETPPHEAEPRSGAETPPHEAPVPPGSAADARPDAPLVEDDEATAGAELVAVFAADKARFDELAEASQFVESYRRIESRRVADERGYVLAFAALLGVTILLAVGVGSFAAGDVARRVVELAAATQRVAAGDLSVRVPEARDDELGTLAREFNRMLTEVETSRARIEYLQRISAWQEMARRLAHEIKNPLTPIQLAVQDIHRRYEGKNPEFQKLLDTTLEVVEDEVGTLRRLVGEFSDFARLPQAELEPADMSEFLRELSERPLLGDEERRHDGDGPELAPSIRFEVPAEPVLAKIDRQMLRRVVINLVQNSVQALAQTKRSGHVLVRLVRQGPHLVLDVEDDGPGIPPELRAAVFDPYVTTRTDGTGLGLAIVKKIVVEHHGTISAEPSPEGGARLRVRLPALS